MTGKDLLRNMTAELERAKGLLLCVYEGTEVSLPAVNEVISDIRNDLDRYYDVADGMEVMLEDLIVAEEEPEMKQINGQIQTVRGLIYVEASYQSEERAKMDGYSYAWNDPKYGKIYSKCTDGTGHSRTFALIEGYR